MGIIQRQGMKQAVVTYVAVAIGAVNLLFIYPKFLTEEEFGIIRFVNAAAALVLPFVLFGSASLIIRFFPRFKDKEAGHQGWLGVNLGLVGVGFTLLCLFSLLFQEKIFTFYSEKSELYLSYLPFALPFVLAMGILNVLGRWSSCFHRIVVPPIFSNLGMKVGVPTLVILYSSGFISFDFIFRGTVLLYLAAVAATLIYIKYLGQLFFKIKVKAYPGKLVKEMWTYGSYSFFGTLSAIIATQIDMVMIGSMEDLKKVAAYSIAFYVADVIDVPRRAIEGITNPILSDAFKKNDIERIAELYRKTAITQLTIGLLLFIGIWASVEDIFAIIPNGEKYAEGKIVILILGVGALIDQGTGINSFVIGYSKYFRFHFWLILIMSAVNIGNNLLFIPIFSIAGAALATALSKLIYNLSKTIFVWKKLKMHPFSKVYITVIILAVISYFIGAAIPTFSGGVIWVLLGILLRSLTIGAIFVSGVYYFKVSEDINALINKALRFMGMN